MQEPDFDNVDEFNNEHTDIKEGVHDEACNVTQIMTKRIFNEFSTQMLTQMQG